jgi:hypothetical protein
VRRDAHERDGRGGTAGGGKAAPHNGGMRTRGSRGEVMRRAKFHFLGPFFMTVVGNAIGTGWFAGFHTFFHAFSKGFRAGAGGTRGAPNLAEGFCATGAILVPTR